VVSLGSGWGSNGAGAESESTLICSRSGRPGARADETLEAGFSSRYDCCSAVGGGIGCSDKLSCRSGSADANASAGAGDASFAIFVATVRMLIDRGVLSKRQAAEVLDEAEAMLAQDGGAASNRDAIESVAVLQSA
jgi:hypothetical protein